MPTLYVEEFADLGRDMRDTIAQAAQQPSLTSQTVVTTGTSKASTNAFSANTALVMLHADGAVCYAFGLAPTATTASPRLGANETRWFTVKRGGSLKVACITSAVA